MLNMSDIRSWNKTRWSTGAGLPRATTYRYLAAEAHPSSPTQDSHAAAVVEHPDELELGLAEMSFEGQYIFQNEVPLLV